MQVSPWVSATRTVYPAAFAALISWKVAVAILAAITSGFPLDWAATGVTKKSVRARIGRPTTRGKRRADLRLIGLFIVMFPFLLAVGVDGMRASRYTTRAGSAWASLTDSWF